MNTMSQNPDLNFLKDGQALPTLSQWKQFLERDTDGALSVCRTEVAKLPTVKQFQKALNAAVEQILSVLEALQKDLQLTVARIPQANGFFAEPEDIQKTFVAVCYFLERLGEARTRLGEGELRLSQIRAELKEGEAAFLRCEMILDLTSSVARSLHLEQVATEYKRLNTLFERKKGKKQQFSFQLKKIGEEMQGFCVLTLEEFCQRIKDAADLAQKGENAHPSECLHLLGELKYAMERLSSAIALT